MIEFTSLSPPSPSSFTDVPRSTHRSDSEDVAELKIEFGPQEDEQLRLFDLETKFGPCMGLSRLQRWNRAERWGRNPPSTVKELLTLLDAEDGRQQALWHDSRVL